MMVIDGSNEIKRSSYNISDSNGSESGISTSNLPPHCHTIGTEIVSLKRLSSNLEWLLHGSEFDCSDAEIVVEGVSVCVHRCILAARSPFFREFFAREKGNGSLELEEKKPQYLISNLVTNGKVGYEALNICLNYIYTGKLMPSPPKVSTCVDPVCAHDACRPAVNFAVELMYASSGFRITELVSLFQRRLFNFVEKAVVEDVIPILLVAFSCQLNNLLTHCIQRVARSNLDSISIEKELPLEVANDIKSLRLESCPEELNVATTSPIQEKNIRRLYKALDSDDIELVKLLLSESNITLDDAYALHYAAAYCDSKLVAELLELGLANVNLKNTRGYTMLHVAAMRREPAIIVSLLTKGASVLEITDDGISAVRICRRLTRARDYHERMEQGKESNKDRICIDILEREERRNPMVGEASVSLPIMADELHMKLLHLENRVAFAKLLFPTEAKLAMEIAHTGTTSEFSGISASKDLCGNLSQVDLNETPTTQTKKLRSRMLALLKTGFFLNPRFQYQEGFLYSDSIRSGVTKVIERLAPDVTFAIEATREVAQFRGKIGHFGDLKTQTAVGIMNPVELGRRYFPHCSEVLDKFMDDDLPDLFFLEKGTPDEQKIKRLRFNELRKDVHRAFSKDKAEFSRSRLSSSSSSSSFKEAVKCKEAGKLRGGG